MSTADLLDGLATLVEKAKPIRFTDQVRLNRRKVYELTDDLRASLPAELSPDGARLPQPALEFLAMLGRVDELVQNARAVPLTGEARVARADAAELVGRLRTKLAQALEPAPVD